MSVSVLPVGCVSSLAARRAGAAAAHGPADEGQPVSSGPGRVLPRAAEGEALHRHRLKEIACSKTLDDTLTRIAAEYYERLAPAIDRVWQDEIASMRTDLRVWVDQLATNAEWEPWLFEFAFGLPGQPGHDPASLKDPVTINGKFILRGSIDLVERKPGTKILRVTDHKTGKNRSAKGAIIGGGAQLQPIIYSLAVEQATGCTVRERRASRTARRPAASRITPFRSTRRPGGWASRCSRSSIAPWSSACCRRLRTRGPAACATSLRLRSRSGAARAIANRNRRSPICIELRERP